MGLFDDWYDKIKDGDLDATTELCDKIEVLEGIVDYQKNRILELEKQIWYDKNRVENAINVLKSLEMLNEEED